MAAQDSHVIELAVATQDLPIALEIVEEDSSPAQPEGSRATQPEIEEETPLRAQEEPYSNPTLHSPSQPQSHRSHVLKESMRNRLENHRSSDVYYCNRERCPTIRMVPSSIRKANEGAYTPKLVSIGPFHRGKLPELMQVEPLKWSYLQDLIQRSPDTNSVSRYVDAVWEKLGEARKQYLGDLSHISDDDFVEMLVLDGCFVLEFLFKRAQGHVGYPWSDFRWNLTFLRHDLLLLENQIPFFVIQLLFDNTHNVPQPQNESTLTLMSFVQHYLFKDRAGKITYPNGIQVHHLLYLYHRGEVELLKSNRNQANQRTPCLHYLKRPVKVVWKWVSAVFFFLASILLMWKIPSLVNKDKEEEMTKKKYPRAVPTARKLRDAGVKFRRKKQSKEQQCFLDVSFNDEDGEIEMPQLSIQNTTVSSLRNLIALEQCSVVPKEEQYFTSFAVFMDQVIDTSEDVAILSDDKVIESKLGCDEDVATLFNGICSGVSLDYDKHYLKDLFRQVNRYSQSERNQWRADLVRRYFHSPWAKISFFAAFLLLASTVLQTVYTVRQSYNKS